MKIISSPQSIFGVEMTQVYFRCIHKGDFSNVFITFFHESGMMRIDCPVVRGQLECPMDDWNTAEGKNLAGFVEDVCNGKHPATRIS